VIRLPKIVSALLNLSQREDGQAENSADHPWSEKTSTKPLPAAVAGARGDSVSLLEPDDGDNKFTAGRDWRDWGPSSFFNAREPEPFHQHDFRTRAEFLRSPNSPKILISDHAYRRMCLIVEMAPKEVGWLGTVDRMPSGNFYIDEIFVPEQEVTGAETDPTDEGQFKVMNELAEMGEEGMKKIERLRFWGHSHVFMGTSPSGTDENTPLNYERLGLPWFIRGIFNKLGRAEFTVYLFEEGHRFVDAPWVAVDAQSGEILKIGRAEKRNPGPSRVDSNAPALALEPPQKVDRAPIVLPAKLVLGDTERQQVKDELSAKLTEKRFGFFGGWGGNKGGHTEQASSDTERRASLDRGEADRRKGGDSETARSVNGNERIHTTSSGKNSSGTKPKRYHLTGGEE
jgi:hypothetical protein